MSLLLHFTKNETIKLIIKNGLRLNSMNNTNDIFEKSDLVSDIQQDINGFIDRDIIDKQDFRDFYKLLCFTLVSQSDILNIKQFINKPTMWSHYGEQFKGACLILDKNKFEETLSKKFSNKSFFHQKIDYDLPKSVIENFFHDEYENIDRESDFYQNQIFGLHKDYIKKIRNKLDTAFKNKDYQEIKKIYKESEILFYKHSEWQQENEYRYIFEIEDNQDIFVDIENSIEGFVFSNIYGYDNTNLEFIKELEKSYQDKSFLLDWEYGFPNITKYQDLKNLRNEVNFEKINKVQNF